MAFNVQALKKKLRKKRANLKKAIISAKESGYAFQAESQILRAAHVALIEEILVWINELED